MLAWPSSSCTARRSCEDCSRWLANEWRSMCGCTRSARPRRRAQARRRAPTTAGEIRLPRLPTNRAFSSGAASWLLEESQRWSDSRAFAPTGTVRVFAPLPVTVTSPCRRSSRPSSTSSATSSPRRSPEEYSSSNIAASRTSSGVPGFSSRNRRCAASTDSAFGSGRGALGARMPSTGLTRKPRCRTSQPKQPRHAESVSASERGPRPLA